jgi:hypothetical protein
VINAKSGAADRKRHDLGAVGQGSVAAVPANDQGLVDKLAGQAEKTLELTATDTGGLSRLPARGG